MLFEAERMASEELEALQFEAQDTDFVDVFPCLRVLKRI